MDAIIAGLLGGTLVGAALTFVQFLINRADKKMEKNDKVMKSLAELGEKIIALNGRMDQENSDDARRRILGFDDELRRGVGHSEESYNQILDDIRQYEHYCQHHDDYKNSKAVVAIQNIKDTYAEVKKEDKFL